MFLLLNSVTVEDVVLSEIFEGILEIYIKAVDIVNLLAFVAGVLLTIAVYVTYTVIREVIRNKKKKPSDIEVITYDEFNERRQKKGEPDE